MVEGLLHMRTGLKKRPLPSLFISVPFQLVLDAMWIALVLSLLASISHSMHQVQVMVVKGSQVIDGLKNIANWNRPALSLWCVCETMMLSLHCLATPA